jgi:hypothetical protein
MNKKINNGSLNYTNEIRNLKARVTQLELCIKTIHECLLADVYNVKFIDKTGGVKAIYYWNSPQQNPIFGLLIFSIYIFITQ